MFQNVNKPGDLKLSKTDTLKPEMLEKMRAYYKERSGNFWRTDGKSAQFALDCETNIDHIGRAIPSTMALNHSDWGCHNPFTTMWQKGTTGVINLFTKYKRPSTQVPFMDFLLDPVASPWAKALQHVAVVREPHPQNKKISVPTALILTNTRETNLHIFTNLLIAGRHMTTYCEDQAWCKLVDAGFHPNAAFILSMIFQPSPRYCDKDNSIFVCSGGCNNGDQAFAPILPSKFSTSRFMAGDPKDTSSGYSKNNARPNPCNHIWEPKKSGLKGFKEANEDQLGFAMRNWYLGGYNHLNFMRTSSKVDNFGILKYLNGENKTISQDNLSEIDDRLRDDQQIVLS